MALNISGLHGWNRICKVHKANDAGRNHPIQVLGHFSFWTAICTCICKFKSWFRGQQSYTCLVFWSQTLPLSVFLRHCFSCIINSFPSISWIWKEWKNTKKFLEKLIQICTAPRTHWCVIHIMYVYWLSYLYFYFYL